MSMFIKRKLVLIGVSVSLLTACAGSLRVQVDVLDKGYLDAILQQDGLRSEALSLSKGNFQQSSKFVADTRQILTYYATYGCYNEAIRLITPLIDDDAEKAIFSKHMADVRKTHADGNIRLADKYENELINMRTKLSGEDIRVQNFINTKYPWALWENYRNNSLPPDVIDVLMERQAFYGAAKRHRARLVNEVRKTCERQILDAFENRDPNSNITNIKFVFENALTDQSMAAMDALDRTIIGGGSLLATQEGAFRVTQAKEKYWAKNYNQAFGSGQFGSTSTAIKINGLADYTVKGFSFDGRSTANMLRKLAVPTVGFAAAMAGVPIDITSDGQKETSPSYDSNLLSNAQDSLLANQAEEEAYKGALKSMARIILTHKDDLSTAENTNEKKSAKQRINANYEANRTLLGEGN